MTDEDIKVNKLNHELIKYDTELLESMEYLRIYPDDNKKKCKALQSSWAILKICEKIKELTKEEDSVINEKIIFAYQCEDFIQKSLPSRELKNE